MERIIQASDVREYTREDGIIALKMILLRDFETLIEVADRFDLGSDPWIDVIRGCRASVAADVCEAEERAGRASSPSAPVLRLVD